MNFVFRKLKAEEIDVRAGTISEKGSTWLLYKDARVDMNLLDTVVGWNNWQREHKEIKGVCYCGVSIWDEQKQQWVTKWDAGKESQTEAEKGEASDSFKRACVNATGVGRELYTAPLIFIPKEEIAVTTNSNGKYVLVDKFAKPSVSYITYDENGAIKELKITYKNKEVFTFPKSAKSYSKPTTTTENQIDPTSCVGNISEEDKKFLQNYVDGMSGEQYQNFFSWLLKNYGTKNIGDLTAVQGTMVRQRLERAKR